MKHKKEWYECDRCGAEIYRMPNCFDCISRIIGEPSEIKMKVDEYNAYKRDETMIEDGICSAIVVESHRVKEKRFDLCPKCGKEFERFMNNEEIKK